jgi:N-acetylglucosaminyl-diphospho-decaprenol L-rhamnosyltransferase
MTPEVSAVVVSHRSAAEAAQCVASLAMAFAQEGIAGEVVLVDCGSGEEEAAPLRDIPADKHLLLPENRGYSGGVNAGLAQARAARLILSNADVVFSAGSIGRLLEAIAEPRVGVVAPLSTWDSEGRVRLPPGYAPGLFRDAAQLLSGLSPALDRRRFSSFARETLRLWERGGRVPHLSGAVLAARRDVFDAAGRFDERFPFEYEETEWEDRVRAKGFDLLFVPEARVRHIWAASSSRNPETAARRAASERLYRLRRYGQAATALLEAVARLPRPRPAVSRLSEPRLPARAGAAVALSPNPSGVPFAVADLSQEFFLPDEVRSGLAPGLWYLTVFRKEDGRPLERSVWDSRHEL